MATGYMSAAFPVGHRFINKEGETWEVQIVSISENGTKWCSFVKLDPFVVWTYEQRAKAKSEHEK